MKFSIKYKLFLIVGIVAAVFVAVFSVLYLFFYNDYVLYTKNRQLDSAFKILNETYDGDIDSISDKLTEIELNYGVRTIVFNQDREILYDGDMFIRRNLERAQSGKSATIRIQILPDAGIGVSRPEGSETPSAPQRSLVLPGLQKGESMRIEAPYEFFDKDFIRLVGRFRNGDFVFLSASRPFIEKTGEYTATFLLIATLISLLVCFAAGYLTLNKVTKPIIRLNAMAQKMSNLDFSDQFQYKGSDEIYELGKSINKMSSHLEETINRLKEANTCLKEEVEKERKIDQMRKNLLINVSHELKTPLALIKGYAEGLRANLNSDEESRSYYCSVIEEEADGMTRLIEKLLHLSRIETGNIRPEPKNIDLKAIVEEGIRRSGPHIGKKGLLITSEGDCCGIYADPQMAKQVFINYLTNAIDHTPEGKSIRIWWEQREGKAVLSVYNEGSFIEENDLSKIWTAFYKVDRSRKRTFGGTGIGLSIVSAIAQAHKTECGARNEENGITFYFVFDGERKGAERSASEASEGSGQPDDPEKEDGDKS